MKSDIFVSTGFGLGYLPAPGTAASLAVTVLFWLTGYHFMWLFAMAAVAIGGANISYGPAARIWGGDPSKFVLDEMLGMSVALTPVVWISHNAPEWVLYWTIGAFGLFRLFDILKPLGISSIEKLPGLKGVMADDLLAAAYTVLLQVLVIFTVLS